MRLPLWVCGVFALACAWAAPAVLRPAWSASSRFAIPPPHRLRGLERSYWVHASLAALPQKGYWGPAFPAAVPPTPEEVKRAAGLLAGEYGANRLYLIYHQEIPLDEARRVFAAWRRACPRGVELVPAFVLRMYDKAETEVFRPEELRALCRFLKREVNARRAAVYDIYPKREQGPCAALLAEEYPGGLIRVGLQPGEPLAAPFVSAVEDTWSALCHGKSSDDWQAPGFGAETLRRWVAERNAGALPVAWDLVAVAWDYSVTERGAYPGYDDAEKNMPLPAGRNRAAAREVLAAAAPGRLAGFSSDLFILQVNSRSAAHDRPAGAFYEALKRGERYAGYYAAPLREIASIYRELGDGRAP